MFQNHIKITMDIVTRTYYQKNILVLYACFKLGIIQIGKICLKFSKLA